MKCGPQLGLNRRGSRARLAVRSAMGGEGRGDGETDGERATLPQAVAAATCSPQFVPFLNIVFRITSSFRMQAVSATLLTFP